MTDRDDDEGAVEGDQTLSTGGLDDFYSMFQRERDKRLQRYQVYVANGNYAKHLTTALKSFQGVPNLHIADLVQWKTFLRNAEFPAYGAPAILVDFLAPQTVQGSLDEPDVATGYLDGDQDLQIVRTHSLRLMAWESEST
ncbi:hypothetical protein ET475_00525 [Microbacterium protaetiae]|uniref:Uncharacterized protein n=1 Tax=Microbacterium protaetiae TaxID=2509458 RepID=A0A4P6E9B3_9MICO|nr:hypothetical protein [Microbacterium protaetiae]QAY58635.1 hypothetical protein ET475_00525 [Microbacterium protaetiae]